MREAVEGLELLKKMLVGIMALPVLPNRRMSELLRPSPVRPPTPTGWSRSPKEDSIYVSSSYDPERRLPPMKMEDLTAISIMARFKRFNRRLLEGKKKMLFEEPFKERCKEILSMVCVKATAVQIVSMFLNTCMMRRVRRVKA
jgi:hypothetical protein